MRDGRRDVERLVLPARGRERHADERGLAVGRLGVDARVEVAFEIGSSAP
jgi:hypothetical protein